MSDVRYSNWIGIGPQNQRSQFDSDTELKKNKIMKDSKISIGQRPSFILEDSDFGINNDGLNNILQLTVKKNEAQIDILLELKHTTAYTGELGKLKQDSYVLYSDILEIIKNKRNSIKELVKQINKKHMVSSRLIDT